MPRSPGFLSQSGPGSTMPVARQDFKTGPSGSLLGELIDKAGARNLVPATGSSEPPKTSLAEIARWNPEVVVTHDSRALSRDARGSRMEPAPGDPGPSPLSGPRTSPSAGSTSRPASIGCSDFAGSPKPSIPSSFTQDLRTAAREFCALFYQVELSEAQLDGILAGSQ